MGRAAAGLGTRDCAPGSDQDAAALPAEATSAEARVPVGRAVLVPLGVSLGYRKA